MTTATAEKKNVGSRYLVLQVNSEITPQYCRLIDRADLFFLFLIVKECNEWDPRFRNENLACLVMKHEFIYLCRGGGRRKHVMGIRFVMILVWENTGQGGPD